MGKQWLTTPTASALRPPGVLASGIGSLLRRTAATRSFDGSTCEYIRWQEQTAAGAWKYYEQYIPSWSTARLKVLDLGAGSGARSTAHARVTGATFFCVDIDFSVLSAASRMRAESKGRVLLTQADATSLPFAAETFDVCLCENVLEHFDRPDLALMELARVLRPSGRMFALFPPWRGPYSGHLRFFTSMPWIHLLPASVIVRLLLAIRYPELVEKTASWRDSAVSMVEGLARHLNGWSLAEILDGVKNCPALEIIDAYALGEWPVSRLLRFVPWCGEFFTSAVYLVCQKRSLDHAAAPAAVRIDTYNDILEHMGRLYLRRALNG